VNESIFYNVEVKPCEDRSDWFEELWRLDGKFDRSNGPAIVIRNSEHNIISERWYTNGLIHRIGGPALTHNDGVIESESWFFKGEPHRKGGPSLTVKKNGLIVQQEWEKRGIGLHREDGPARIVINLTTEIQMVEGWYQNGKLHRLEGPALSVWNGETGELTEQRFCKNGRIFSPQMIEPPPVP